MNVLYTKADCPMCGILKTKLDFAGIKYSEFTDEATMRLMGINALPVLEMDGEKLYFGQAVALANKKIKEMENE